MAGIKSSPGVSAKMMAATLTPDVVEKIYMPKFRLFARGEPAYAGIGAIFNAINLRFAREELKKSNHFNSTENTIKFDNAAAGLVASVSQWGHEAVESIEKSGAKIGEGWLKLSRAMEMVGKFGGAVVGLVSAAIDGYHAWDEAKHGNLFARHALWHVRSAWYSAGVRCFRWPYPRTPTSRRRRDSWCRD